MRSEREFKNAVAKSMNADISDIAVLEPSIAIAELDGMEFCSELISSLGDEHPDEFQNHRFYRWTLQKEDVHVVWGKMELLSVQIDPYCKVICAFKHEVGSWERKGQAVDDFLKKYSEYLDSKP